MGNDPLPTLPPRPSQSWSVFAGAVIAVAIGCADAFTRSRFGTTIDLGFIGLGLAGLGLQGGGVLPR